MFAPGRHPNHRHPLAECLQPGGIEPRRCARKTLHRRHHSGEPQRHRSVRARAHLFTAGGDATPAPSACQAGLKQTPPAEAHRSYCCYKVNERKLPRPTGATSVCCSVQESIRVCLCVRLCACVCLNGFHDFQMFCLLLAHTHAHTRTQGVRRPLMM